ncbi:EcsC family protein [Marivita sp. S6314]|uniref:EcsC family protein n=1 Tax=Marivita sp. S6314 TaxID=2926406 RepID=UPI001FF139DA|nr:EcsC family protein [Marivita sp. S6314]MCK0149402.1 EcsC family protein [Marivita sp. S6314]
MTGSDLVPMDTQTAIANLARRHKAAGGVGMQVLNMVGGRAENLLERLPDPVKLGLEGATERALKVALYAAKHSRGVVPDQKGWLNTALTTTMGAVGGAGGLPTALAELPVTTTVLLRAVQGIAAEHGFDPNDPDVLGDCLTVFASAGPLAEDDGANTAFFSTRVTLTGAAVHGILKSVAPRLATVLGQKLAAQTVPILGAAAGAATNYAFTSYYQEMAHVHFGLRRLAIDSGQSETLLVEDLKRAIKNV